nr:unnamed protein product [Naegleria fowleri]
MQHAYETKKSLKDAIFKKDVEQVRHYVLKITKELPSPGIENIFLRSSLRHARIFLEQNSDSVSELDAELDDKEKRKREVIERIKNIIEKSDNFSADKQNKFTQLLLQSGIRDATVLKELRLAWEEKKKKLNENRIVKMLEKYIEEEQIQNIEVLLESNDCSEPITEELRLLKRKAKILISRKKRQAEGALDEHFPEAYDTMLDGDAKTTVTEISTEKSAHNFCNRLMRILETKNLTYFDLLEQEFTRYVDDSEVLPWWDKVCTLKEQHERATHQLNIMILSGNNDYKHFMDTLSKAREFLSRDQYDNFLRRWKNHRVELFESEIRIALQEDNEQEMLRLYVYFQANKGTIFGRNDTISDMVNLLHKRAGRIAECRQELQEAIERREPNEIERAIIKARRYKSLRDETSKAEIMLDSLIGQESKHLYLLERAMKSKNPLLLRRCLEEVHNFQHSSDKLHTLYHQADLLLKELENEYQLVEDLELCIQSKDLEKILDLRDKCKNLRHISAEQVLKDCDTFIKQSRESVQLVRSCITGTFCTKQEFEDYMKQHIISMQDKTLLRKEWINISSTKILHDMIYGIQSCDIRYLRTVIDNTNDFLLSIGNDVHFESVDTLRIKLKQAQELVIRIEKLKNEMSTEIINDQTMETVSKALQEASGIACLKDECTMVQKRVQLFMMVKKILQEDPRPVLKDVEHVMQQALSLKILDAETLKSLFLLRERLSEKEYLKQELETALRNKDSISLRYCLERGKYLLPDSMEKYRNQIDQVLAQQENAKAELWAITKRFVELKVFDENEYLKFRDILPEQEINAQKEMVLKICQQDHEQAKLTHTIENQIREQIRENEKKLHLQRSTLEERQQEKELILQTNLSLELDIQNLSKDCESLKQQAIDIEATRDHIDQIKVENENILTEQKERIRIAQHQLAQQEDEIRANKQYIEEILTLINQKKIDFENTKQQMMLLQHEHNSLQVKLHNLTQQIQNERTDIANLQEGLEAKEQEIVLLNNTKQPLLKSLEQLQEKCTTLNEDLEKLRLQQETLINEELNARKKLESIKTTFDLQLMNEKEQIENTERDIETLKSEISKFEKEKADKNLERQVLDLDLKNCQESISSIQNSIENQRQKIKDLKDIAQMRDAECVELAALAQQEQLVLDEKQFRLQEYTKQRVKLEELRQLEEKKLSEEINACEQLHQEILHLEKIRNDKEEQARNMQQEKYNLEQAMRNKLEDKLEEENTQIKLLEEECKKKEEERLLMAKLLQEEVQRVQNQKQTNEITLRDLINEASGLEFDIENATAKVNELQKLLALKEREASTLEERHVEHVKRIASLQKLIEQEEEEFKREQNSIAIQKESNQTVLKNLKKQLQDEENNLYELTDLIQKKTQENNKLKEDITLLNQQHLDLESILKDQSIILQELQKLNDLKLELEQKEAEKNQALEQIELISQQKKQLESMKMTVMEDMNQCQEQLEENLMKVKELEELIKKTQLQRESQAEELSKREAEILLELQRQLKEQEEKLKSQEMEEQMKLKDEEERISQIHELVKLKVKEREQLEFELAQAIDQMKQLEEQQKRDNAEKQTRLNTLFHTHRLLEEQHDSETTSIKNLELSLHKKQQERHDLEELLQKEECIAHEESIKLKEAEQKKIVQQEKLKELQQEHATITALVKKEETVLRVEKENVKRLQNDIQNLQRKRSQLEEKLKNSMSKVSESAVDDAHMGQASSPLGMDSTIINISPLNDTIAMSTMNKADKMVDEFSVDSLPSSTEERRDTTKTTPVEDKTALTEKKKAILPSKANKKPTPASIDLIDYLLTELHKKGSKGEFPQDDKKHYILPLNDDLLIALVQQYACILCDKCIIGKGDLSRFYHVVFPKFLESLSFQIKAEQNDIEAQQRSKKLFAKLRHVKKTFAELEHVKSLESAKEYTTLSLLFIFYSYIYGVFTKEFWDYYCSALDFLKEHYDSSSILVSNADSREDLNFLVKKQSKFKCILADFETVVDHQKEVVELLLMDNHNSHQCLNIPPVERLKGVLYEIRRRELSSSDNKDNEQSESISEILRIKFTAGLLFTSEVGFRQFKFFGRYFFWDHLKFYLEKVAPKQSSSTATTTLIQELYQNTNERMSTLVSKEPNDLKFALFVCMAINKKKLEEIFRALFVHPQIGEYFSEDAIIRSDKVKEVLWILAQIDAFTSLPEIDISQVNNLHFDYEKGSWICGV